MKCRFEHRGDCCNSGSPWYLSKCEQPCDTIIPMTNADRIRAMSDEELAEFLCKINGCYQVNCPGSELCEYGGGKANGLKKWLQQPAEEAPNVNP